ncbi:MAG TPA: O-antigen ligase family protein [Blastocatellia bacterium]|jgi:exopolysaccharide production protein ExoQ|nr:O-antigen ligase family protein [Blastocatellia bacterium]
MSSSVREDVRPAPAGRMPARSASSSVHKILIAFLAIGLLLEIGAFRMQLGGIDPSLSIEAGSGSTFVQVLMGLINLAAAGLLLCSRQSSMMLRRAWPLFLMPALAFASMLWSPEPEFTFRKSVAFLGTVLFGFLIATVMDSRDAVRLIVRALSLAVLLSVAWVFLFPEYGTHNATDYYQAVHAGAWRGIFSHRTVLGNMAALTFALLICYGSSIWASRVIRYTLIVLSIVCVIKANSGGGFLTAAIVPVLILFTQVLAGLSARGRALLLMTTVTIILPLILFSSDLLTLGLSVLHKQPNLTGRVPLWNALLTLAHEQPFLGFGFAAGFAYEVQPRVFALTGFQYAHCHNGYLEALIAFGYIGLGICLMVLMWLLSNTGKFVLAAPSHLRYLSGFPFVLVMYVAGINCIESLLVTEGTFTVTLLALAGGLVARTRKSPGISIVALAPAYDRAN